MKQHAIEGDFKGWVNNALRQASLFTGLDAPTLELVIQQATLWELDAQEVLLRQGEAADAFFMVLMGEMLVTTVDAESGAALEVGRLRPVEPVGEMALLAQSPRTATVTAVKSSYVVRFDAAFFDSMCERLPGFARRLARIMGGRLEHTARRLPLPEFTREEIGNPPQELVARLPAELMAEYRLLPLRRDGDAVIVGFVDRPDRQLAETVRRAFQGARMIPVRIAARDFDELAGPMGLAARTVAPSVASVSGATPAVSGSHGAVATPAVLARRTRRRTQTSVVAAVEQMSLIEPILRHMIEARASDLHLSAGQPPRWRVDGDLVTIPDQAIPRQSEVYDLLEPFMSERTILEFEENHDCDFAFAVEGIARFRVNMYRDSAGVGAAFRLVPSQIPTMDQILLPKGAQRLVELNQGLVLVCGPTGSGKSTTLAAMLSHINQQRRSHIITIEDPIEFHHESRMCKVTQREVGKNTVTFQRALRSALREDPDIVLVGELRDQETMALALETAQTGHLVFSTLHTSTAIGTIDRIIDMFPVEQHNQVRSTLADVLKGVINQNLCRRQGGGRVGAYEVLMVSSAVSNCIRTAKTTQIATIMTTGKAAGNQVMNENLEALVRSRTIDIQEALLRSVDRAELRTRLGLPER
jgi:twitching motility protein PilT